RGAINHDRAPGVHRYAQLIEHPLREYYASKGVAHIVGVDATMVNGLQFDQGPVGTHRKRCCAYITATRQGIAGGTATTLGQAITQHLPARLTRLAKHFDTTILAQKRQDLFKYRA